MTTAETAFLQDLDRKLWNSADRLRSSLDAAVYKHIVLGLIFLKYASDAFDSRRAELEVKFRNPDDEYFMDPQVYGLTLEEDLENELENRDYYKEVNVFWVPPAARWTNLKDVAKLASGAPLPWGGEMKNVRLLLDHALAALGRENEKLKRVLAADTFTKYEVPEPTLTGLIDVFSGTNFSATEFNGQPLSLKSKDILGHVYEYFLGEFAQQEGKKGGQYYTPKSIVTLIVEMLQPFRGRVYDPAMGSGGFFVQSEEFIEHYADRKHVDKEKQRRGISVYGQESNPTTWRLAAMNMAIRGLDFDFGEGPADSFLNDQHPDLRADYVMANPPFNMKEWGQERLREGDPRWEYGLPPANNANFAWLQHMLYHLAPTGSMALLLANGSMSSNTSGEGDIRRRLVEADLVECMVALPGQLFTNTQIPACIWFLTKSKAERGVNGDHHRDRRGEILFIDARQVGYMKDRVLRDFRPEDIARIADTFHTWQRGEGYSDAPGFCHSAFFETVKKHDFVLTPGRYVGAAEGEEDGEAFAEKMARLTRDLGEQFRESKRLEGEIARNLSSLGFSVVI
jgi:type I restriction enzyme M protein